MDVLATAEQFCAEIDERSVAIEDAGSMPPDLADRMADAGLFRLLIPEVYGGLEVHPQVFFDTLKQVAAADGAVGWCQMIGNTTGLLSASLPQEWAETIYGANPNVITVGVTAPIGKAVRGREGLTVSGRWPFGSGSQVADWICGGCVLTDEQNSDTSGPPNTILAFFPAEEVTIHTDSWDVSGLKGTGSHDIQVIDAQVPDGRWVTLGKRPLVDRPLYRFPTFGLLALGVSAVASGIGQRALDEFVDLASAKTPTGSSRSLANRPSVQKDVAQAEASLASALAMTREFIEAAYEDAVNEGRLSLETKARLRLAAANNAWSAAQAVDRLYHAAGGTSIYRRSKLQQCFRDVHVATQHIMVAQPIFEATGKVTLGLDPKQPL